MRRAVFSIALTAGLMAGAFGVRAQNENNGGDLNWPATHIIDDAPVPQQPAKPKPGPAEPQQVGMPPAGQQAPVAADSVQQQPGADSVRVPRSASTRQQPRRQWNGEARRHPATPASTSRSDEDEDMAPPMPPFPERREATAPVSPPLAPIPQVVPVAANLAQAVPANEPDERLGKIIGQMIIIGFQGVAPDESWPRQVAAQIESGRIGGVVFMNHNIQAPRQLAKLTGAFRRTKAQVVPFIVIDQEGGAAQPFPADKGFQHYRSAAEIGMSNDPLNAYNLYQRMAIELSVNGFNVNLGPVVDLDQSGAAAVSEDRYGSHPKHVAAFAKAFRLAHHNEGVLTVLKHFPGPLGAKAEPVSGAAEPEPKWDAAELEPYRQLTEGGNADMVMVGHLSHAEFSDEPGLPASLSAKAIQTRLREEVGFKGIVISDDLQAKSFAARFPLEESVVRAIKAGNDMLLLSNQDNPSPDLPDRVAAIINQALATGALTRERLQASYDRIVAAKRSLSQAARDIASAKQSDGDEEKPSAP